MTRNEKMDAGVSKIRNFFDLLNKIDFGFLLA
jgi:hypothetical protein